ncbi:SDR family NAD(P)-dependent oxidoreductase [Actinophytocola oryzae]|uniref:Gluconate 5-dehydrogenase/3-oxoacyl-[acyl-carrier protein] reductase n=1 Tax=Actinophytocola oryzae TaxID=502181 RepID=A0A4R7W1K0_9PSEU|nr:SDR family oxidoreductase [Actinophytocola oryzae]TDV56443.1 gluconate 5-dehydrogenase/3-oxoacyl-[acyl-carrier protein] reductase [Actinophytocola oryzae]
MESELTPFAALKGNTAVVTGAARGIGFQIATTLQGAGMTLLLVDRDGDELDRAVKDLGEGGPVVPVVAELTAPDGFAGVESALGTVPPLRVWVNNAGVVSHQDVADVDMAEFERVLRVNAETALRGCQVAYRAMREETDADRAIVNLSSLLADKALPQRLSYATSKTAVETITHYAAQEWGRFGIRVNAVSPGYVDTRLTAWPADDPRQVAKQEAVSTLALRRAGSVEDIANAVLFLASPMAAYVTGTVLRVDGGWHLA